MSFNAVAAVLAIPAAAAALLALLPGYRLSARLNVVATLPGTQAASKDRTYVVSGHYDSRVTDVMNYTADAPGANDDASGTAA